MRKLIIIVLTAVTGVATITFLGIQKSANTVKSAANSATAPKPIVKVNGAENPEMIPDHVAYSLVFDLIANRETEKDKRRIRAYIRESGLDDTDANLLIDSVNNFREQTRSLDTQAAQINVRTRSYPPPVLSESAKMQLRQLENQRTLIVNATIATLHSRLSANGSQKLHKHINERVKRKTKIFASEQEVNNQGVAGDD